MYKFIKIACSYFNIAFMYVWKINISLGGVLINCLNNPLTIFLNASLRSVVVIDKSAFQCTLTWIVGLFIFNYIYFFFFWCRALNVHMVWVVACCAILIILFLQIVNYALKTVVLPTSLVAILDYAFYCKYPDMKKRLFNCLVMIFCPVCGECLAQ